MSFYNQEIDRIAELEKENEALRQQRDELLEALEKLDDFFDDAPTLREIARKAIAKAHGIEYESNHPALDLTEGENE